MTNITEQSVWEPNIYQLSETDPVLGGQPGFDAGVPVAGHANAGIQQLANRSKYIKETLESDVGADFIGFRQSGVGAALRDIGDRLRESVSVKDFGAVGNGVTDDTAAIQAAVDYCQSKVVSYGATSLFTGKSVSSFPAVTFPAGVYKFSNIKTPPRIKIICFDNPIFTTDDISKYLFITDSIYTSPRSFFYSEFSGFSVIKSKGLFSITGPDETMSRVTVSNCEFAGLDLVFDVQRASLILDVFSCRFDYNYHIADGYCDHAHFHDSWIEAGQLKFDGDAVFNISNFGSEWYFTNILGVPNHPNQTRFSSAGIGIPGLKDLAWVNAYRAWTIKFENFRGGGELGGLSAVNWRAPYVTNGQTGSLYGTKLIVRDSQITDSNRTDFGDGSSPGLDSNPCSIRLFSIPNTLIYEACSGNNQNRYAIGVGSTITSFQDLVDNSQDVSDTTNTGITSLRGLKWDVENVTDSYFLSGGSLSHPLVDFLNEAIPRKRLKYNFSETKSTDYKALYDKVGRKVYLTIDSFLMPAKEREYNGVADTQGVRGVYEVSVKFNPRQTWSQRVYKVYRMEVLQTVIGSPATDKVTLTELYSKLPSGVTAGTVAAQLALDGTPLGDTVTTPTAWNEIFLELSLSGTTLIDKMEIEIRRIISDYE